MSKPPKTYPHIIPDISEWPIFKLSEDRRNFVQEIEDFTQERLMDNPVEKVTEMLAETIFSERIRIKEEPWKVDPPNERQFWTRIRRKLVKYSLDRDPEEAAPNNAEILRQIIHRYSEEIVGTFRIQTFLFARKFLTWFFNRLLQAKQRGFWLFFGGKRRLVEKLAVEGHVEAIRKLALKGTVVVVPTHFSNLDSILIGYAMDTIAGLPSFSYGAGLNLYNTGYTAYFMNRLGAYRVDRRKKNAIYLETLKTMSNLSIRRGVNSLFFPGGTRSRSGALETKLKLGLLSTVVEAQRSNCEQGAEGRKVFVVPVVLGYHFVLEAMSLIEQHLRQVGKERFIKAHEEYSSIGGIIRFVWQILAEGNDIMVSFGQPLDVLGNPVDDDGNSFDKYGNRIDIADYFRSNGQINKDLQRESEYTKMLADAIVDRYHRDNYVLSSHLVAFAAFEILRRENSRLDLYGILRLPPDDFIFSDQIMLDVVTQLQQTLLDMEARDEIKLSPQVRGDAQALIQDGITHLGTFHINKPLKYSKSKEIISENFFLLYFYHNRLDNYGLQKEITWKDFASIDVSPVEAE